MQSSQDSQANISGYLSSRSWPSIQGDADYIKILEVEGILRTFNSQPGHPRWQSFDITWGLWYRLCPKHLVNKLIFSRANIRQGILEREIPPGLVKSYCPTSLDFFPLRCVDLASRSNVWDIFVFYGRGRLVSCPALILWLSLHPFIIAKEGTFSLWVTGCGTCWTRWADALLVNRKPVWLTSSTQEKREGLCCWTPKVWPRWGLPWSLPDHCWPWHLPSCSPVLFLCWVILHHTRILHQPVLISTRFLLLAPPPLVQPPPRPLPDCYPTKRQPQHLPVLTSKWNAAESLHSIETKYIGNLHRLFLEFQLLNCLPLTGEDTKSSELEWWKRISLGPQNLPTKERMPVEHEPSP